MVFSRKAVSYSPENMARVVTMCFKVALVLLLTITGLLVERFKEELVLLLAPGFWLKGLRRQ
jgi:hypothetical protein